MHVFRWRHCTTAATSVLDFLTRLYNCRRSPHASLNPPLSDPRLLLLTTALYLLLILALRARYRAHPPRFARTRPFALLAAAHHILLSLLSLAMNLVASRAIFRASRALGFPATVCTPPRAQAPDPIQRCLYVFYLSKFYELLDTVLLVLRGRPLTLLHVWHHASVMYEVWGWLEWRLVIGVYGMWFNTLVHVIMYAYFAAALLHIRFPCKKAITVSQIVQFVTGFASLVPYMWLYFTGDGCRGTPGLAVSALCNASYLFLFLRFFRKTYTDKANRKTKLIEGDASQEQRKVE